MRDGDLPHSISGQVVVNCAGARPFTGHVVNCTRARPFTGHVVGRWGRAPRDAAAPFILGVAACHRTGQVVNYAGAPPFTGHVVGYGARAPRDAAAPFILGVAACHRQRVVTASARRRSRAVDSRTGVGQVSRPRRSCGGLSA